MSTDTSPRRMQPAQDADDGEDAIDMLTADHDEVRRLFAEYDELADEVDNDELRAEVVELICQELTVHARVEEEVFYPAASEAIAEVDLIAEAAEEHERAKDLIAQLQSLVPADSQYDETVRMLQEAVHHHVLEEEGELFPLVRGSMLDLVALGQQMAQRKDEVLAELEEAGADDQ